MLLALAGRMAMEYYFDPYNRIHIGIILEQTSVKYTWWRRRFEFKLLRRLQIKPGCIYYFLFYTASWN
jgi:hypothetical protein